MLKQVQDSSRTWDVVIVGGGATGLGCAVDAALRGYSVALFEREDFAKCTSSRSTKLVHGGVRYLQKGDVMLVLEALRERGRMKANAPHLVKDQAFVISNYSYWDNFLYFCGLAFYDILSFGFGYGRSRFISAKKVRKYLPTSVEKGLKGGVVYHDGQFDDARMAVNLAQTCVENGGAVLNRTEVVGMLHDPQGKVADVKVRDTETGATFDVKARSVINAAGAPTPSWCPRPPTGACSSPCPGTTRSSSGPLTSPARRPRASRSPSNRRSTSSSRQRAST